MSNIHPFVRTRPFDPALADAMGLAFESAWQRLLVSGTHLASSAYAASTREALAMHIIDLAERGERDVHRFCEVAVAFVLDALQCKQADGGGRPMGIEHDRLVHADRHIAEGVRLSSTPGSSDRGVGLLPSEGLRRRRAMETAE